MERLPDSGRSGTEPYDAGARRPHPQQPGDIVMTVHRMWSVASRSRRQQKRDTHTGRRTVAGPAANYALEWFRVNTPVARTHRHGHRLRRTGESPNPTTQRTPPSNSSPPAGKTPSLPPLDVEDTDTADSFELPGADLSGG